MNSLTGNGLDDLVNFASSSEDRYSYKFNKNGMLQNLSPYTHAHNNQNQPAGVGSFLNDITIEGVDDQGRVSMRSIRDSNMSASSASGIMTNGGGQLKWKKKSELSKPLDTSKSRISIKGDNQYELVLQQDDPFKNGRKSSLMMMGASAGQGQNRQSWKLGMNSEQRISRISSLIQNQLNYRNSILSGGQP